MQSGLSTGCIKKHDIVPVVVFARELVEGSWNWGEQALPRLSKYTYLGVDFTSNGAWDDHEESVAEWQVKINEVHN